MCGFLISKNSWFFTFLSLVLIVLVSVIIPVYISWKYDISPRDVIKCLWLYVTGRTSEAVLLLRRKEDRTKPVRWFFWIPFVGRIFMHNRDMGAHPELRKELIISLIENTVVYFVVGLIGGIIPLNLQTSLMVISLMFLIILPLEYKLTLWKPKLFLSDGDIEYVEYVGVFYHAYLFMLSGTLLGYLMKGML